jgi:hypothetical protein
MAQRGLWAICLSKDREFNNTLFDGLHVASEMWKLINP